MSAKRFSPKTRGIPSKYDPEKHPIDIYLLAKEGKSNNAIAQTLGVDFTTLESWIEKHAVLGYALSKARNVLDENGKSSVENFREYVYKRLPKDLQRYWDEIEMWHEHRNGAERIEALLQPLGTKVRQSLWLHAMIHCDFNAPEACRMVNVPRGTVKTWTDKDPDFPRLLDELIWYKKHFFEGALLQLVKEGNTLATIFANKTMNRDMGYVDKVKVEHSGTVNVNTTVHVRFSIDKLNLPLEVRTMIRERIREAKKVQAESEPKTIEPPKIEAPKLVVGRARLAILDEDDDE